LIKDILVIVIFDGCEKVDESIITLHEDLDKILKISSDSLKLTERIAIYKKSVDHMKKHLIPSNN